MKELLARMTLPEKIGQMMQLSPWFFVADLEKEAAGPIRDLRLDEAKIFSAGTALGIGDAREMIEVQKKYLAKNRLGIPLMFCADVIHGYRTIFPVPLALSCTWNPDAARIAARVAAAEAATAGVHMTYAPMADLVRDPRWGRVVESFGEDPHLLGLFAAASVEGFQGDDHRGEGSVASCVKHFAGYGAPEGGREYATVDLSRQALEGGYLEGYRKAVEAGARGVMTAFNVIEGVPCTINRYLLRDVLRDRWGFTGITITDYDSLHEVLAHGAAEDERDVARKGVLAGLDVEMASTDYVNHLEDLVRDGIVDVHLIDEAVLRILELKRELGLFDDPFRNADPDQERVTMMSDEHLALAKRVALESAVLLKNDGALPLRNGLRIALIGPFATSRETNGPWSWHGNGAKNESLAEVLARRGVDVTLAKDGESASAYDAADVERIRTADVVLLMLGENAHQSGEAHARADIALPGTQAELVGFAKALGRPAVVVLQNGRPLVLEDILAADAILEAWFLGTKSSEAVCDLLYGIANPSGRLTMSFPRSVGQIPVHYDGLPTGRPNHHELHPREYVTKYIDQLNSPRFPFGYGLSYASFAYGEPVLSAPSIGPGDRLTVAVDVKNESAVEGVETVQLYLRDRAARVSRPVLELKAFERVRFAAFETRTIRFELGLSDWTYRLSDGSVVWDPGRFTVFVGPDSVRLKGSDFVLRNE
ncbi:MAG: glycoside hydrolase family 3 N-terminal domain-containing protein [Candidatus Izemoplasmatales bacterium]